MAEDSKSNEKDQKHSLINHLGIKQFGQSGINAGDEVYQIITTEHNLNLSRVNERVWEIINF
jgi:hypothetical protein